MQGGTVMSTENSIVLGVCDGRLDFLFWTIHAMRHARETGTIWEE